MKFLEHFAGIRGALDQQGLWDDADGLFYDRLITPSGDAVPVKVRSMVGIIPALAAAVIDGAMLQQRADHRTSCSRVSCEHEGVGDVEKLTQTPQLRGEGASQRLLLSVARPDQLERLFAKLFDESEFLSPHGLRALSAYHRDHPYEFDVERLPRVHRLRAGRVDHVDVRRQLQLARPGLDAGQLPGGRGRWSATTGSTAMTWSWSTRPGRASGSPWT